jgi:hypothetical protein
MAFARSGLVRALTGAHHPTLSGTYLADIPIGPTRGEHSKLSIDPRKGKGTGDLPTSPPCLRSVDVTFDKKGS